MNLQKRKLSLKEMTEKMFNDPKHKAMIAKLRMKILKKSIRKKKPRPKPKPKPRKWKPKPFIRRPKSKPKPKPKPKKPKKICKMCGNVVPCFKKSE